MLTQIGYKVVADYVLSTGVAVVDGPGCACRLDMVHTETC
jgi:hypothetical protein